MAPSVVMSIRTWGIAFSAVAFGGRSKQLCGADVCDRDDAGSQAETCDRCRCQPHHPLWQPVNRHIFTSLRSRRRRNALAFRSSGVR